MPWPWRAPRLRALLDRSQVERELDEEMRLHLELRARRLQDGGMPPEEARRTARRRFGSLLRTREDSVDAWGWRWLDDLRQDVRFAFRSLRRAPAFAIVATGTLALATGATTALFTVVNGVVLRPLPFPDPGRLVQVYGRDWREDRGGEPDPLTGPVGAREIEEYRKAASFVDLAGYYVTTTLLHGPSGPERLTAAAVDPALFGILGVDALVGRVPGPSDGPDVVVVSEGLWERRFGRSPQLPGTAVTLDGRPFTIAGVMPRSFQFPYRAGSLLPGATPYTRTDVWMSLGPLRGAAGALRPGRVSVLGRIRPEASVESASAELAVIARRLEQEYRLQPRAANVRVGVRLERLHDAVTAPVRRAIWLLFAAVCLVLAAACANVANLLLARMSVRTREVVTRAALGAGPSRLVRQFLAESVLLAVAGGALGALVARWGRDVLLRTGAAARMPRAHEIVLDWQTFAFLLLCCAVVAVLFGLGPSLMAARTKVGGALQEGRGATAGPRFRLTRDLLVVLQVSLAFVLAAGAAAIVRELDRLERLDPGMHTDGVLTLHVTPRARPEDYYAIEDRVAALPGVRAAGFTQLLPLQSWGWEAEFAIKGRPPGPARARAELRYVTPGYFRAMGIPLVRGRLFTPADTADSPRVVLVNQVLARRYLGGADAVGLELDRGTVVGVVGDVRQVSLDRPAVPEIYYAAAQNMAMTTDLGMSLVLSTAGNPASQADAARRAIHDVNPALAVFNVSTMRDVVDDSLWQQKLYRTLIGAFAALTLVLAAIGLYGVIAYTAAARTREFAVRLALGCSRRALAQVVLVRGLALSLAGISAGLAAGGVLTSALGTLPASAAPNAPLFAAIAFLVLSVTALASAIPALRAGAIDPIEALRHE
jgi:predicted permease